MDLIREILAKAEAPLYNSTHDLKVVANKNILSRRCNAEN